MIRLVIVAIAAIGLILFVAFVVSRLIRSRTRGVSIRMQIFLALAVIVGAFAFGLGLMVLDRIEARAVRLATQAAQDEANAIAGVLERELDRDDLTLEQLAKALNQEKRDPNIRTLQLIDPKGRVLFPSRGASLPGEGVVTVDAPILIGQARVGQVRVVKPTVVMRRMLADFAPTILVISLVLGAAAALAAAWIGRAIAAPIESLSLFSEQVSAGQRSAAPRAAWGREVTRLTRSIDSMRRQLEGRPFVETFAADLSHELKNPVAAIRASAEILEESALEEPEEARRFVSRIKEATLRIERLLGELLSLARLEARGTEVLKPIDLGQLVRRQVELVGDESSRFSVKVHGDVRVRGDPTWFLRAVANLVSNALVHSEPNTPISVEVLRHEQQVWLRVKNRGTVAEHIRERLFRRFVTTRVDKGGTGLGLAIVRAVAEAHGGTVGLVDAGPSSVQFELRLPAARAG